MKNNHVGVWFHETGFVERMRVGKGRALVQGKWINLGPEYPKHAYPKKETLFYENGLLKVGFIPDNEHAELDIMGRPVKFMNRIEIHQNENVKKGRFFDQVVSLPVQDKDVNFTCCDKTNGAHWDCDGFAEFHEDGSIKSALLADSVILKNVDGEDKIYTNGSLIQFNEEGLVVEPE